MQRLSTPCRDALKSCKIDANKCAVKIATNLDRAIYEQVDEVFRRLGGKWAKSAKAHIFATDPSYIINAVVASGDLPPDDLKDHAFFPTPQKIARLMVESIDLSSLPDKSKILEPHGGVGGILDVIKGYQADKSWQIETCELLDVNYDALQAKGYNVVGRDYLTYSPDDKYDAILTNPPFAVKGDSKAYITHIMHSWQMLAPYGKIAAITPCGWLHSKDKRSQEFATFVCDFLRFERLGSGEFKTSNTMVDTMLIYGDKTPTSFARQPYLGWPSHMAWEMSLSIDNDYNVYKQISPSMTYDAFARLVIDYAYTLRRSDLSIYVDNADLKYLFNYYTAME